jgi:hypothetical protein
MAGQDLSIIVATLSPAASHLHTATQQLCSVSRYLSSTNAPEMTAVVTTIHQQAWYCRDHLFPASQQLVRSLITMLSYYNNPGGMYYWERNIDRIALEAKQHHTSAEWTAAQCATVAANLKVAGGMFAGARAATQSRAVKFAQRRTEKKVEAFLKKGAGIGAVFVGGALAIPTLGLSLVALVPAAVALEESGQASAVKAADAKVGGAECEVACAVLDDGSLAEGTARFQKVIAEIGRFFAWLEHEVGMFAQLAGNASAEVAARKRERHWCKMQGKARELLQACAALNSGFATSIQTLTAIR